MTFLFVCAFHFVCCFSSEEICLFQLSKNRRFLNLKAHQLLMKNLVFQFAAQNRSLSLKNFRFLLLVVLLARKNVNREGVAFTRWFFVQLQNPLLRSVGCLWFASHCCLKFYWFVCCDCFLFAGHSWSYATCSFYFPNWSSSEISQTCCCCSIHISCWSGKAFSRSHTTSFPPWWCRGSTTTTDESRADAASSPSFLSNPLASLVCHFIACHIFFTIISLVFFLFICFFTGQSLVRSARRKNSRKLALINSMLDLLIPMFVSHSFLLAFADSFIYCFAILPLSSGFAQQWRLGSASSPESGTNWSRSFPSRYWRARSWEGCSTRRATSRRRKEGWPTQILQSSWGE